MGQASCGGGVVATGFFHVAVAVRGAVDAVDAVDAVGAVDAVDAHAFVDAVD